MANTKPSAFAAATLPLAGTEEMLVLQGGVWKRVDVDDVRVIDTVKSVGTQQNNATTTPAAITDFTTSLAPGTYRIRADLVWRSAATTAGAGFFINCSGGTVTRNTGHVYTTTTGTTATTGVADQATVAATFQMIEARAWRANNTDPGPFGGVDTANADQYAVMEAIVIVTATTSLQIMFDSETTDQVSIMPGSTLTIARSA